jgi:hypothetical protein
MELEKAAFDRASECGFKYYGFLVEVLLKFDEAVTVLMGLWSKVPSVDDPTLPLLTKEEGRQPLIFLPKYPALYRSILYLRKDPLGPHCGILFSLFRRAS